MHFNGLLMLLLLLLSSVSVNAEQGMAIDPATCLGCHGDKISVQSFAKSVHGKNACTSCHVDITDLLKHMKKEIKVQRVQCERCHKKANSEHYASIHAEKGIMCAQCHTDIHTHTYWKNDKRVAVTKCIQCHDKEKDYQKSVHGKAVVAGNMDSASCLDCHNLHDIKAVSSTDIHSAREFHTKVCMKCHSDQLMMARNKVFTVATKSYMESYHGKNYRLGFPEKVAGCSDCHTAHSVLPKSDPLSSVNSNNLVKTCGQCHSKTTALFTRFYAHGDPTNRDKYPILFYTFCIMSALLLSVFAVFWIHTILWMFRGFIENREKTALLAAGGSHEVIKDAHKQYRRFNQLHIFLHVLVITSFLLLALTGLPLRFSDQTWAIAMMKFFGSAANAGLLHRIGACITFIYFGAALVMSINFLFIRKDIAGNCIQRLFGPDSLCFNLRDIRDLTGMVKWFFFKGPKPSFERWTYWEKFDFFAVFWGMFAIGGSGLMLWFPEFFAQFLPGWVFNVATIIHSDEALLATGFIFTVHFFNTHGRPEKFPMDFVIFNGQVAKWEMIEERGDQWKRYEEEGLTDQHACKKTSGALGDFLFKGFGLTALLIGLGLLVLMIIAFLGVVSH
ncbi:MAG: cytochrome C [Geobacteraceae bacterium GWB2_52_12]|nr:MAG: cytochrome C [Geobacteraceae bacterium GWB2_52_12]